MIILSHHHQRTNGRAFRPKNGWEHRKCCFASFPMSARSGERPAPGALFNYQCITLVKWKELIMKGVRRQRNKGFRLASFMSKMMVMMMLVMKGVRRQGNTGCILALIMSRMMPMMICSHHYQHQTGRSLRQKNGGEHRNASYDSVAEECEERGTTWTRSTIQLSSISVRVCHERCLAAEEYRLYTGFDHVEDDVDDVLVSSLSASNWAGTPSKERRLQKSARSGERPAPGALFS